MVVGWNDTTLDGESVTDSRGNSYTLAIGPTTGTGLRQSIYYAKNIVAGSNTVTVTFNQAAAYVDVRVLEYSGLDTTNPLDVTAGASGSGTSANSGSATTSSANESDFRSGMTTTHYTGAGSGLYLADHHHAGCGHCGRSGGEQHGELQCGGAGDRLRTG